MAVQPFMQAIWGDPHIEVTFHQFVDNGVKVLGFDISNNPIYSGILTKLAVYRRTAEGVRVDFFIYDSSGKEMLMSELEANIEIGGKHNGKYHCQQL